MARRLETAQTAVRPSARDHVPAWAFGTRAGGGDRTRTTSLGIRRIRAVRGVDLRSDVTVSARCRPLFTLANCTLSLADYPVDACHR